MHGVLSLAACVPASCLRAALTATCAAAQRFVKKAPATPEAAPGAASASASPVSAARQPRRLDFPYQQLFSPPPKDKRCGAFQLTTYATDHGAGETAVCCGGAWRSANNESCRLPALAKPPRRLDFLYQQLPTPPGMADFALAQTVKSKGVFCRMTAFVQ